MAKNACTDRLQKEYRKLLKDPSPNVRAHPAPSNLLEWHYALEGPSDSDFAGGIYHGKVVFPKSYPFAPPSILMLTPNGRFAPNTNLCLSMTDYHPESWNPMWSVGTMLTGLLSFMLESAATTGAVNAPKAERQRMAVQSWEFNAKNPTFRRLFPEYANTDRLQHTPQQPSNIAAASGASSQVEPAPQQHKQPQHQSSDAQQQQATAATQEAGLKEPTAAPAAAAPAAQSQGAGASMQRSIDQAMRQLRMATKSKGAP